MQTNSLHTTSSAKRSGGLPSKASDGSDFQAAKPPTSSVNYTVDFYLNPPLFTVWFHLGLASLPVQMPGLQPHTNWQNYLVITTKKELCPWTLAEEWGIYAHSVFPGSSLSSTNSWERAMWDNIFAFCCWEPPWLETVSCSQVKFAFSCSPGVETERPGCRSLKWWLPWKDLQREMNKVFWTCPWSAYGVRKCLLWQRSPLRTHVKARSWSFSKH